MLANVASETDISGDSTTNRSVFLSPMLNPAGLAPSRVEIAIKHVAD